MKLALIGFGYVAKATARRMSGRAQLYATTRTEDRMAQIREAGVEPVLAAPATPDGAAALNALIAGSTHVIVSVPPGEAGDPVLAALLPGTIGNKWIGYLSTTGVYGDCQGGWAFEWDDPAPGQRRSVLRREAEIGWQAHGATLFRLAGIYGPGQSPFDRIRRGEAARILKPGHVFSRIHVDDIASALDLAMARDVRGEVFNLADDRPEENSVVTEAAARMLGLPPPPAIPFDEAQMSPMMASFYAECRRVSNARAKAVLGWRLRYPTWREGLAAILQTEKASTAPAP